jgi:hypothetical protein
MASLTTRLGWLAGAALLAAAMQAQAQDKVSVFQQQPLTYLSGSVGMANLDFGSFDVDSPILGIGMGAMVNKYVGVEIRLARSVTREDHQNSQYALDHLASALATLRFPVWRFIYGQAYAGISDAQVMSISPTGDTERNNDTTLSYGLDLGIHVVPHWRVSAGYSSYIDKSYWKVTAIEGSLQYLF